MRADGTYFLRNLQTGLYADIQGGTMSSGKEVEQQTFDGASTQKWKLVYYGGGDVYTIRSAQNNSYYLGIENNSTADGANIVLRTGTVTSGMKWRIMQGNEGWKICAFSDTSMVLATNSSNATAGQKLILGDWVDNDSYRDEWDLYGQHDYTLMYIGEYEGDPLIPPIVNSVSIALKIDARMDGYGYTSLTTSEALGRLSSTSLFSCITHGSQTFIETSDDVITISDINSLSNTAFDNLKFVYLGACSTGVGENDESNLVNAIYDKGADAVLGFNRNIWVDETYVWTKEFMIALANGMTIGEAIEMADEYVQNNLVMTEPYMYITSDPNYRYFLGSLELVPCG